MTSLEAIAERRAAEQLNAGAWKQEDEPRILRIVSSTRRLDPRQTCDCGACAKCRKREAMRVYREGKRNGSTGPQRRGKKMATDRVCEGCRGPVAVCNRTGFCAACTQKHMDTRIGHVAQRRQWFSHGGGI